MKPIQITLLTAVIAIALACGYGAKTSPPVAGMIPAVTQLAPDNANAGGPAFTLTVNGSNFGTKAVVNFNGAAQTTTYVSANQITAAIPAAAIATSGTATVTVTNPGTTGTGLYGSGGTLPETSTPTDFTIN